MFGSKKSSSSSDSTPYTPTNADPSVIMAGLQGFNPSKSLPEFSTAFKSLIGGAGGRGIMPFGNKRSLIGGSSLTLGGSA